MLNSNTKTNRKLLIGGWGLTWQEIIDRNKEFYRIIFFRRCLNLKQQQQKPSHLFWFCISSSHRLLPPAAHRQTALHHCETASLSAWTGRRNLSNSQHVRGSLGLPWGWRNLRRLPFSSSFTSKSSRDKGQPNKQKAGFLELARVLERSLPLPTYSDNAESRAGIVLLCARLKGKGRIKDIFKKKWFTLATLRHRFLEGRPRAKIKINISTIF